MTHSVFPLKFEVRLHSSTLPLYLTLPNSTFESFSLWGQEGGHSPHSCPLKEKHLVLLHLAKLEFTNFTCSMGPAITGFIR